MGNPLVHENVRDRTIGRQWEEAGMHDVPS